MCHINYPTHYYDPHALTTGYPYAWGGIIPPPSSACPQCGRCTGCGLTRHTNNPHPKAYTISAADMPPFSVWYSGTGGIDE